jgi:hypothetical protein
MASTSSQCKSQIILASKDNDKRTLIRNVLDLFRNISSSSSSSTSSSSSANNLFNQTSLLETQLNPQPMHLQSRNILLQNSGSESVMQQSSLVNELDHVVNQIIPQKYLELNHTHNEEQHSQLPFQQEQTMMIQKKHINEEISSSNSTSNLQHTITSSINLQYQDKSRDVDVSVLDYTQIQSHQNKNQGHLLEVQQQQQQLNQQQLHLQQQIHQPQQFQSSTPLLNVPSVSNPVQQQALPPFHQMLLALVSSQLQSYIFQQSH